jgi:septal ring factor EnvC (AmiA/AmiB activator)
MKYLLLLLLLGFGYTVGAQEVNFNGETYKIKKERIFKDSIDVTETLSDDEKQQIRAAFNREMAQIKESEEVAKRLEKAEKEQKKAEKERKKAEKEQKKVEKALKKKEKAQSNFEKAVKKHEDAIKKYEKLKKKGKLSPVDEEKWLKKMDDLKENIGKTKQKL